MGVLPQKNFGFKSSQIDSGVIWQPKISCAIAYFFIDTWQYENVKGGGGVECSPQKETLDAMVLLG